MFYEILAILVAIIHGLIVIILFFCLPFAVLDKLKKWPWFERVYLTIAILMIVSFIFTSGCYLTDIEQWLWRQASSSSQYTGGYISHYLGMVGISIADIVVYWFLTSSLIIGLGSYMFRYLKLKLKK